MRYFSLLVACFMISTTGCSWVRSKPAQLEKDNEDAARINAALVEKNRLAADRAAIENPAAAPKVTPISRDEVKEMIVDGNKELRKDIAEDMRKEVDPIKKGLAESNEKFAKAMEVVNALAESTKKLTEVKAPPLASKKEPSIDLQLEITKKEAAMEAELAKMDVAADRKLAELKQALFLFQKSFPAKPDRYGMYRTKTAEDWDEERRLTQAVKDKEIEKKQAHRVRRAELEAKIELMKNP